MAQAADASELNQIVKDVVENFTDVTANRPELCELLSEIITETYIKKEIWPNRDEVEKSLGIYVLDRKLRSKKLETKKHQEIYIKLVDWYENFVKDNENKKYPNSKLIREAIEAATAPVGGGGFLGKPPAAAAVGVGGFLAKPPVVPTPAVGGGGFPAQPPVPAAQIQVKPPDGKYPLEIDKSLLKFLHEEGKKMESAKNTANQEGYISAKLSFIEFEKFIAVSDRGSGTKDGYTIGYGKFLDDDKYKNLKDWVKNKNREERPIFKDRLLKFSTVLNKALKITSDKAIIEVEPRAIRKFTSWEDDRQYNGCRIFEIVAKQLIFWDYHQETESDLFKHFKMNHFTTTYDTWINNQADLNTANYTPNLSSGEKDELFCDIDNLRVLCQDFVSERDFTWKILFHFASYDEKSYDGKASSKKENQLGSFIDFENCGIFYDKKNAQDYSKFRVLKESFIGELFDHLIWSHSEMENNLNNFGKQHVTRLLDESGIFRRKDIEEFEVFYFDHLKQVAKNEKKRSVDVLIAYLNKYNSNLTSLLLEIGPLGNINQEIFKICEGKLASLCKLFCTSSQSEDGEELKFRLIILICNCIKTMSLSCHFHLNSQPSAQKSSFQEYIDKCDKIRETLKIYGTWNVHIIRLLFFIHGSSMFPCGSGAAFCGLGCKDCNCYNPQQAPDGDKCLVCYEKRSVHKHGKECGNRITRGRFLFGGVTLDPKYSLTGKDSICERWFGSGDIAKKWEDGTADLILAIFTAYEAVFKKEIEEGYSFQYLIRERQNENNCRKMSQFRLQDEDLKTYQYLSIYSKPLFNMGMLMIRCIKFIEFGADVRFNGFYDKCMNNFVYLLSYSLKYDDTMKDHFWNTVTELQSYGGMDTLAEWKDNFIGNPEKRRMFDQLFDQLTDRESVYDLICHFLEDRQDVSGPNALEFRRFSSDTGNEDHRVKPWESIGLFSNFFSSSIYSPETADKCFNLLSTSRVANAQQLDSLPDSNALLYRFILSIVQYSFFGAFPFETSKKHAVEAKLQSIQHRYQERFTREDKLFDEFVKSPLLLLSNLLYYRDDAHVGYNIKREIDPSDQSKKFKLFECPASLRSVISVGQFKKLVDFFIECDVDGSGTIEADELNNENANPHNIFNPQPSEKDIKEKIKEITNSLNESLDFESFLTFVAEVNSKGFFAQIKGVSTEIGLGSHLEKSFRVSRVFSIDFQEMFKIATQKSIEMYIVKNGADLPRSVPIALTNRHSDLLSAFDILSLIFFNRDAQEVQYKEKDEVEVLDLGSNRWYPATITKVILKLGIVESIGIEYVESTRKGKSPEDDNIRDIFGRIRPRTFRKMSTYDTAIERPDDEDDIEAEELYESSRDDATRGMFSCRTIILDIACSLVEKFPDISKALFESMNDSIISLYQWYAKDKCRDGIEPPEKMPIGNIYDSGIVLHPNLLHDPSLDFEICRFFGLFLSNFGYKDYKHFGLHDEVEFIDLEWTNGVVLPPVATSPVWSSGRISGYRGNKTYEIAFPPKSQDSTMVKKYCVVKPSQKASSHGVNYAGDVARQVPQNRIKHHGKQLKNDDPVEVEVLFDGNFQGRSQWSDGKILRQAKGQTYDVLYDDGECELDVPNDLIRRAGGSSIWAASSMSKLSDGDVVSVRRRRWIRGKIVEVYAHEGCNTYDVKLEEEERMNEPKMFMDFIVECFYYHVKKDYDVPIEVVTKREEICRDLTSDFAERFQFVNMCIEILTQLTHLSNENIDNNAKKDSGWVKDYLIRKLLSSDSYEVRLSHWCACSSMAPLLMSMKESTRSVVKDKLKFSRDRRARHQKKEFFDNLLDSNVKPFIPILPIKVIESYGWYNDWIDVNDCFNNSEYWYTCQYDNGSNSGSSGIVRNRNYKKFCSSTDIFHIITKSVHCTQFLTHLINLSSDHADAAITGYLRTIIFELFSPSTVSSLSSSFYFYGIDFRRLDMLQNLCLTIKLNSSKLFCWNNSIQFHSVNLLAKIFKILTGSKSDILVGGTKSRLILTDKNCEIITLIFDSIWGESIVNSVNPQLFEETIYSYLNLLIDLVEDDCELFTKICNGSKVLEKRKGLVKRVDVAKNVCDIDLYGESWDIVENFPCDKIISPSNATPTPTPGVEVEIHYYNTKQLCDNIRLLINTTSERHRFNYCIEYPRIYFNVQRLIWTMTRKMDHDSIKKMFYYLIFDYEEKERVNKSVQKVLDVKSIEHNVSSSFWYCILFPLRATHNVAYPYEVQRGEVLCNKSGAWHKGKVTNEKLANNKFVIEYLDPKPKDAHDNDIKTDRDVDETNLWSLEHYSPCSRRKEVNENGDSEWIVDMTYLKDHQECKSLLDDFRRKNAKVENYRDILRYSYQVMTFAIALEILSEFLYIKSKLSELFDEDEDDYRKIFATWLPRDDVQPKGSVGDVANAKVDKKKEKLTQQAFIQDSSVHNIIQILFSDYKTIEKCLTVNFDSKLVDYIEEKNKEYSLASLHSNHFGLKLLNPFPYLSNELRFAPSTLLFQSKEMRPSLYSRRNSFNHVADILLHDSEVRNFYFYNKKIAELELNKLSLNGKSTESLSKLLCDLEVCNSMWFLADAQCLLLQSFKRFSSTFFKKFHHEHFSVCPPTGDSKKCFYDTESKKSEFSQIEKNQAISRIFYSDKDAMVPWSPPKIAEIARKYRALPDNERSDYRTFSNYYQVYGYDIDRKVDSLTLLPSITIHDAVFRVFKFDIENEEDDAFHVFNKVDTNGNGELDEEEINVLIEKFKVRMYITPSKQIFLDGLKKELLKKLRENEKVKKDFVAWEDCVKLYLKCVEKTSHSDVTEKFQIYLRGQLYSIVEELTKCNSDLNVSANYVSDKNYRIISLWKHNYNINKNLKYIRVLIGPEPLAVTGAIRPPQPVRKNMENDRIEIYLKQLQDSVTYAGLNNSLRARDFKSKSLEVMMVTKIFSTVLMVLQSYDNEMSCPSFNQLISQVFKSAFATLRTLINQFNAEILCEKDDVNLSTFDPCRKTSCHLASLCLQLLKECLLIAFDPSNKEVVFVPYSAMVELLKCIIDWWPRVANLSINHCKMIYDYNSIGIVDSNLFSMVSSSFESLSSSMDDSLDGSRSISTMIDIVYSIVEEVNSKDLPRDKLTAEDFADSMHRCMHLIANCSLLTTYRDILCTPTSGGVNVDDLWDKSSFYMGYYASKKEESRIWKYWEKSINFTIMYIRFIVKYNFTSFVNFDQNVSVIKHFLDKYKLLLLLPFHGLSKESPVIQKHKISMQQIRICTIIIVLTSSVLEDLGSLKIQLPELFETFDILPYNTLNFLTRIIFFDDREVASSKDSSSPTPHHHEHALFVIHSLFQPFSRSEEEMKNYRSESNQTGQFIRSLSHDKFVISCEFKIIQLFECVTLYVLKQKLLQRKTNPSPPYRKSDVVFYIHPNSIANSKSSFSGGSGGSVALTGRSLQFLQEGTIVGELYDENKYPSSNPHPSRYHIQSVNESLDCSIDPEHIITGTKPLIDISSHIPYYPLKQEFDLQLEADNEGDDKSSAFSHRSSAGTKGTLAGGTTTANPIVSPSNPKTKLSLSTPNRKSTSVRRDSVLSRSTIAKTKVGFQFDDADWLEDKEKNSYLHDNVALPYLINSLLYVLYHVSSRNLNYRVDSTRRVQDFRMLVDFAKVFPEPRSSRDQQQIDTYRDVIEHLSVMLFYFALLELIEYFEIHSTLSEFIKNRAGDKLGFYEAIRDNLRDQLLLSLGYRRDSNDAWLTSPAIQKALERTNTPSQGELFLDLFQFLDISGLGLNKKNSSISYLLSELDTLTFSSKSILHNRKIVTNYVDNISQIKTALLSSAIVDPKPIPVNKVGEKIVYKTAKKEKTKLNE